MSIILMVCAVALGLVLLVLTYWTFLASMFPEDIRTSEIHTITTADLWKLRMCRYRKGRSGGEPVLLVHGAIANQHNFTSPKDGCLVDYLSMRGYDCWTIDLRGCKSSCAPFERQRYDASMDDYLLFDLPAAIEHIRATTGYTKVHWVGHSMGGMLLYAYALKHDDTSLQSGVTLGAPLGLKDANVKVSNLALFVVRNAPGICGNIVRGFIPIALLFGISQKAFPINLKNIHPDLGPGHLYNMVEDPLPNVLEQLIAWVKGAPWQMLKGEIDLSASLSTLRFPILAIYAQQDPFVRPETGKVFIDSLRHTDKKILVCSKEDGCVRDYGHCDLAFGREGSREVFKPILEWIAAHPITASKKFNKDADMPDVEASQRLGDNKRTVILSGSIAEKTAPSRLPKPKIGTKTKPRPKTAATEKANTKSVSHTKAQTSSTVIAKTKPKATSKAKAKAGVDKVKLKAKPKKSSTTPSKPKATTKTKVVPKKKITPKAKSIAKKLGSKTVANDPVEKQPSEKTKNAIRKASKELKALLDD